MKKFIIIALTTTLLFNSCSLDEYPTKINSDALALTKDGAEQLVVGIYSYMWTSYMMKKTYQEWIDMDHDLNTAASWVVSGAGQGNVTTHWGYNGNSDLFNVFYRMIKRCNTAKVALEKSNLEDLNIAQRYGEVLFLRAWSYFHLVRMYGPVPLVIEPFVPDDIARSPVADIYNVITTDLEIAIGKMSYAGTTYVGTWGHADKTAAQILLARVYCTMASGKLAGQGTQMYVNICNQEGKSTLPDPVSASNIVWTQFTTKPVMGSKMDDGYSVFDAKELYGKAKDLCDDVIERRGMEFDLLTDWSAMWGKKGVRNKEFVWGVAGDSKPDFTTEGGPYYYTASAYGGGSCAALSTAAWMMFNYDKNKAPEQNDIRASKGVSHYCKDGNTKNGQWYRFPSGDLHYSKAPDGLKPETSEKDEVIDGLVDRVNGGAWNPVFPYSTKWCIVADDLDNIVPNYANGGFGTVNPTDMIMIRFAEVYLLRAEALNELDKPGDALIDLNVIRDRAHAVPTITTTDKVLLRSYIFQERGLEFLQEFNRRFDLMRWGMYMNVMNKTVIQAASDWQAREMTREEKCILTAVPTAEIQQNKLFGPNNPGW